MSYVNIDITFCGTVPVMIRPAQTVRSERTREALRRAALLRFLDQGVERTSAEQIAEDAGVTLRTFYRHFSSKHDLLFADYDAGLHWFRSALASRPSDEPLLESVQAAIFAFPYDVDVVTQIASLRATELDPERIVRHIRHVEGDFAEAVAEHLRRRKPGGDEPLARREKGSDDLDAALQITVASRCIAAATFGAMEQWMVADARSLADLARITQTVLGWLDGPLFRQY
jgi:AcrR family transcriptional regulator